MSIESCLVAEESLPEARELPSIRQRGLSADQWGESLTLSRLRRSIGTGIRPVSVPWPVLTVGVSALAVAAAAAVLLGFLVSGTRSGSLSWVRLLTTATWDPASGAFGALAMVFGTVAVAGIAMGIAVPLGRSAAVAINELVAPGRRRLVRGGIELLSAVPSIVYGLVGVAILRPVVSRLFDVPGGDSLLAAALVLAVMVLPTVVSVSVDALASVPRSTREAAASLGLTRSEAIRSAVLPAARPGLRSAALLGLARALG